MGTDLQKTAYSYSGGFQHRNEREFYGYSRVTEDQLDTMNSDAVYRRVIRDFDTSSFYTKGLLLKERMEDGAGNPWSETVNSYQVLTVPGLVPVPLSAHSVTLEAVLFPALVRTDKTQFEGNASTSISTYTTFAYDDFGNVTEFFDAGDSGPADDVKAEIAYTGVPTGRHPGLDALNVRLPETILVKDAGGTVLRKREADYDASTADLKQVRQYLANGDAATTDLSYDTLGNLTCVKGPANAAGQRYRLDYLYDTTVHTHVNSITDSFGLQSTADYDFRFGASTQSVDLNGNELKQSYDEFGRLQDVTGPYEVGGADKTIRFDYHPDSAVPYARSRHFDGFRSSSDTIDTYLFADGLKRVLQTKKDATIHTSESGAALDVMTVSGRVIVDAFGRSIKQYYPVTEPKGAGNDSFNSVFDSVVPTTMTYDVLDRNLITTVPDGTSTSVSYGIVSDSGIDRFRTQVTDAKVNKKETFRDVRELITKVLEYNPGAGQVLQTTYAHDSLKQITMVTDHLGNQTTVSYDLLGRRTGIRNPDTGLVRTFYDLAGNVTSKVTPVLFALGQDIKYLYDHNRLVGIDYPTNAFDVTYTYGGTTAAEKAKNQAGRIKQVTDEAGTEDREYGKLGELTKETRTVPIKNGHTQAAFTTEWAYDTFNRLQNMKYPDGEIVTYRYDSGGLVRAVDGTHIGAAFPYVIRLEYDKFDQRAFVKNGNGTKTSYGYNPLNRRLTDLKAGPWSGSPFQNLGYSYDQVGNVTSLVNTGALQPQNLGGPSSQSFVYDDLYRLTHAEGTFRANDGLGSSQDGRYDLSMKYDTIHRIIQKDQKTYNKPVGGVESPEVKGTYLYNYDYAAMQPHAPTQIGNRAFTYDDNGNQLGYQQSGGGPDRSIAWDEENRIQAIKDGGGDPLQSGIQFDYNDAGERIAKYQSNNRSLYINQFVSLKHSNNNTGHVLSKHIFIGNSRVLTHLGSTPNDGGDGKDHGSSGLGNDDGLDWVKVTATIAYIHPGAGANSKMGTAVKDDEFSLLDVNPHGTRYKINYFGKVGFIEMADVMIVAADPTQSVLPGKDWIFYYHPDHLGSTGYLTDRSGQVCETTLYYPFGETWMEEHRGVQLFPNYSFTGKELDDETGLYYYGARYYDPRTSVWQSVDPMLETYLFGKRTGGVFFSANLSFYSYAYNNPVILIDPDGRAAVDPKYWTGMESLYTGAVKSDPSIFIQGNSSMYNRMDTSLATGRVAGATQSDWFKAANIVTQPNSLGGTQAWPWSVSGDSFSYIAEVHQNLAHENIATFNALIEGKGVPGLGKLSGKELDYALVVKEQKLITQYTDSHFKGNAQGRSAAMKDINKFFDSGGALFILLPSEMQKAIKDNFESKGTSFNYGSEADRITLGKAIVDQIREARGRDKKEE
jgi:RHS repeat-associated protein